MRREVSKTRKKEGLKETKGKLKVEVKERNQGDGASQEYMAWIAVWKHIWGKKS